MSSSLGNAAPRDASGLLQREDSRTPRGRWFRTQFGDQSGLNLARACLQPTLLSSRLSHGLPCVCIHESWNVSKQEADSSRSGFGLEMGPPECAFTTCFCPIPSAWSSAR